MARYTVKYNRTTNHIAGLDIRTTGGDLNYSKSACAALSRGNARFAVGLTTDDLATALRDASTGGRKVCKFCRIAAEQEMFLNR